MTLHKIRTIMSRFRYGTATEEKDDFDNWISRTPQEIYESGEGICYDALVLEDALMNEADIEHVNVFAVSERELCLMMVMRTMKHTHLSFLIINDGTIGNGLRGHGRNIKTTILQV